MFKWLTLGLAAIALLFLNSGMIRAGEKIRIAAAERIDAQALDSEQTLSKRVSVLEAAAELGVLEAQLKLARMYETGQGAPRSHARAFDLYRRIVDDQADVRPHHARAGDVAHAFVALGGYYRAGIPGSAVRIDKRRAARLLWHAASYLGDAEAQCALAQMYLEGEGMPRNSRLALNWLTNAAKKRHGKAQAQLGDLLWRGSKDIRRQPLKGLALLSLARQNATDEDQARWIEALYIQAYERAQAGERAGAGELAERWQERMGRAGFVVVAPEQAAASPSVMREPGASPLSNVAAGFTNVGMESARELR